MLTKLLVTAAVIFGVFIYLRRRNDAARAASGATTPSSPPPFPVPFRMLAYGLAGFVAVSAFGYMLYDYHDSRRLLMIKVVNPINGETVEYRSTKGQLKDRSFETINGQTVRVSENERLIIQAVDE